MNLESTAFFLSKLKEGKTMKYRRIQADFRAEQQKFYYNYQQYDKIKQQHFDKMAINGIHPFRPF